MSNAKKQKGFTLVELAIVIVIIGLIISGVVGAQSLIESSKRSALNKEAIQFANAFAAFRLEYSAVPGDMDDAWDYWGVNCASTEGECNGDGNEMVERASSSDPGERVMAWKHLELAEIVSGSYTGLDVSGTPQYEIDVNIPGSSAYDMTGFFFLYLSNLPFSASSNINVLTITGTSLNDTDWGSWGAVMTPADAYKLDKKFDDGNPGRGDYVARSGYVGKALSYTDCSDANYSTASSGQYQKADDTDRECMLFYTNIMR